MAKRKKKPEPPSDFLWEWEADEEPDIITHMQRLANHMVKTGIEMGMHRTAADEEARADRIDKIMETEEWEVSQEEMDLYLPKSIILEKLHEYSQLNDGIRSLNEAECYELTNKLAEICVYGMMKDLEVKGIIKLCWDPKRSDFVYVPVDPDGDEWKHQR
jgi:hypothetical protein